jgi:hypothetical protein
VVPLPAITPDTIDDAVDGSDMSDAAATTPSPPTPAVDITGPAWEGDAEPAVTPSSSNPRVVVDGFDGSAKRAANNARARAAVSGSLSESPSSLPSSDDSMRLAASHCRASRCEPWCIELAALLSALPIRRCAGKSNTSLALLADVRGALGCAVAPEAAAPAAPRLVKPSSTAVAPLRLEPAASTSIDDAAGAETTNDAPPAVGSSTGWASTGTSANATALPVLCSSSPVAVTPRVRLPRGRDGGGAVSMAML